MSQDDETIIALLHGPDQPGLVTRTTGWIYGTGGNVVHADLHRDPETAVFFQRIEWVPARGADFDKVQDDFASFARGELAMTVQVARSSHQPKVGIMVSKIPHCFHDIMLRFQSGELRGHVACVVSNHRDLEEVTERYGVPFHHTPVTKETKAESEARQIEIFREHGVELVLMARYMQILSGAFLEKLERPVINIHHSFLPAFAGGRPYHQAYQRGVKIIGATAHYATTDLDEGPIIAQDVTPISHRHTVHDLVRRGSDLEKVVFALAVRHHLEHRVLVYDNKTVVFD